MIYYMFRIDLFLFYSLPKKKQIDLSKVNFDSKIKTVKIKCIFL